MLVLPPLQITPAPSPKPIDPLALLGLDDTRLSRLANELAREIYSPEDVLKAYGIPELYFNEYISKNTTFCVYYAEAHAIWHSATNTKERVALKAGVLFEESLREGARLLHDPASPMAPKVELMKFLGRIAGFEQADKNVGADKSISVVINLSHAQLHPKTIEINKTIDGTATEVPQQVTIDGN